jgi:rubrerythrin
MSGKRGGTWMDNPHDEVSWFSAAVRIEEAGITLYTRLLSLLLDGGKAQEEIEYLLEQENYHRAWFERALAAGRRTGSGAHGSGSAGNVMPDTAEASRELELTLSGLLSGGIPQNAREALALGREVERETIRFYERCIASVPAGAKREELRRILAEEKEHYQRLNLLLE